MLRKYQTSGRVSPLIGLSLFPGLLIIAAVAAAYAWQKVVAGYWVLNVLSAIAAMFAAGAAMLCIIRLGKLRHAGLAFLIGTLGAATFLLAMHAAAFLIHPAGSSSGASFGSFLQHQKDVGFTLSGGRTKPPLVHVAGAWITLLWVLEAIAFFLALMAVALAEAQRPFCESCRSWAIRKQWTFALPEPTPQSIALVKQARSLSSLLEARGTAPRGPSGIKKVERLEYAIRACRCGRTAALVVHHIKPSENGRGSSSTELFADHLLDNSSLERLYDWAERIDPSMSSKRMDSEVSDADHSALLINSPRTLPTGEPESFTRVGAGMSYTGCDNAYTRELRKRLEAGDFEAAEVAIAAQTDPNDRAFVIEACADWSQPPAFIKTWEEDLAGSATMLLVRGINKVIWAWTARGANWTPKDPGTFWDRLREAEIDLHRAAELLPDDPLPWSWLITSSMGLQLGQDEHIRRFKEALRRDPKLRVTSSHMIQALAGKWGGSDDKMLAFALKTGEAAPAGSPVHVVIAEAHCERAWSAKRAAGKDSSADSAYWSQPAVGASIVAANQKCFRPGSLRIGMETPRTRAWFAYALWKSGAHGHAAEHLRIMGKSTPWSPFQPNLSVFTPDSLAAARRECGV